MIWFGERTRTVEVRAAVAALETALASAARAPPGPERHAELAAALIRAGALAQGIADAERPPGSPDDRGRGSSAALHAAAVLGRAVWASWRSGGRTEVPDHALARLARAPLPGMATVRRAEGFAYYAAYPEAWAVAGTQIAGLGLPVLGIRSIGTTLAVMVAAGAGAAGPLGTVRPAGHPFRREVALGPRLSAALGALRRRGAAVADEGPGLSGSSFGAVLAAVEALGIPPERVHLFPSHPGDPGPEASPAVRDRYARARRHLAPFEALFLERDHPLALARLAEDVIGPPDAPPQDVSAGAWRRVALPPGAPWPPSQGWRERRKYLCRAGGRTYLARFAGLGDEGQRALARARILAAAGLAPAPVALRHGFLWTEWIAGARPLWPEAPPRAFLLAVLRRHLGFVASRFPADPGDGATPAELLEMARVNAAEALGPSAVVALARAAELAPEVVRTARPVAVDGKVDGWEWLLTADGRVLKADAFDHCGDHALPGAQDALWDVAGVELAFDLTPGEGEALAGAVRGAAPGAHPRVLPFYRACRAAFEVARWTLAAGDGGLDADEADRRRAARDQAVARLRRVLS
jgi:hypothetical protein